jgi:hypothetical protein
MTNEYLVIEDFPDNVGEVGRTIETQDEGDVFEDLSVVMHDSHIALDAASIDEASAPDFIPPEMEKQAASLLLHAYQRRRVARQRGLTKSS